MKSNINKPCLDKRVNTEQTDDRNNDTIKTRLHLVQLINYVIKQEYQSARYFSIYY